jgi:hypothetical protein
MNEATINRLLPHLEIGDVEIEDVEFRLSAVITLPFAETEAGNQDSRRVELDVDLHWFGSFDDVHDAIYGALSDQYYKSISISPGDFTQKELDEKVLMIKLST